MLGEEFKLEPEQIIGWASSQEQKKKAAQARALARKGMPDYDEWETNELEAELRKRQIKWGRKKDVGKRTLLEDDDDRRKLEGGGEKRKGKKKQMRKRKGRGGGSAGSAGQPRKQAKAGKKKGKGRGRAKRKGERTQRGSKKRHRGT